MHTFADTSKAAQPTTSAPSLASSRDQTQRARETTTTRNVQPIAMNTEDGRGATTPHALPRGSHNFSHIPLHSFAGTRIQPKLMVSTPGDTHEQEADRVADQVMRMAEPRRQSTCTCGGSCSKCQTGQHRQIDERIQTSRAGPIASSATAVSPRVNDVVSAPGQPLDAASRSFMEPRFGHSFGHVRVHTDDLATQSARDMNARAYTLGSHVVFGADQFNPGTHAGRALLAHELTHVVQQTGAGGSHADHTADVPQLSPVGAHSLIQRDLAIEPPRPDAAGRVLTPAEMAAAIAFNNGVLGSIANSADIIEMIRDVIGVDPLPAVVDEDFVNGVVQWQANFRLTQDGQLGPATAKPLFREIGAEGAGRAELSRRPRYTPAGPINVPRAGARATHFDMSAEFKSDPKNGIFPSCGEIRQDIQWDAAFVTASVAAGNGAVPHAGFPAAHPAGTWIEDRNATNTLRYGHRAAFDRGPGNRYLDNAGQNQAFGHQFEGQDNPSGLAADRGSWSFRLRAIDVCNGNQLLAVSPTLVLNWL